MTVCDKCGYSSEENKKVGQNNLCSICKHFAPPEEKIQEYIREKIDWKNLESFRKFRNEDKNISGMRAKANQGNVVSRAAFGYKIENKQLVPDPEKSLKIQKVFRTFLEVEQSLTQLAKDNEFSVNGLKKILRNFTYIGKVKFDGQIMDGKHEAIISSELFNKVQNKLRDLKIK